MQLLKRGRQICLWHWRALNAFYLSLQAFHICYFVFGLKKAPKIGINFRPPKSGYTLGPNTLGDRHTPVSHRGSFYSGTMEKEDSEVLIGVGGHGGQVGSK